MGSTRVLIAVEFDADDNVRPAIRVADALRSHADFIDDCVCSGRGPDSEGVQALKDGAKVHWRADA